MELPHEDLLDTLSDLQEMLHNENLNDMREVAPVVPAPVVPVPRPLPLLVTVDIKEQPVSRVRFRYYSEGGTGGLVYGVRTTPEKQTHITIRINNYIGPIIIVVSCVDIHQRAHPYKLGAHNGCNERTGGACIINSEIKASHENEYSFKKLGILLVTRKELKSSLEQRKKAGIDPFRKGFHHMEKPKSIDWESVRLAFQVCRPEGARTTTLATAISHVIRHDKVIGDPVITHHSHSACHVSGGLNLFMFCKTVTKDAVIEFYELDEHGAVVWHKNVAPWYPGKDGYIVRTPAYDRPGYDPAAHTHPIKVWFRLKRTETRQFSASHPLDYLPMPGEKTKRKRVNPHLLKYDISETPGSNYVLTDAYEWFKNEGALSPPAAPTPDPTTSAGAPACPQPADRAASHPAQWSSQPSTTSEAITRAVDSHMHSPAHPQYPTSPEYQMPETMPDRMQDNNETAMNSLWNQSLLESLRSPASDLLGACFSNLSTDDSTILHEDLPTTSHHLE